jgi:hypothetical protein
MLFFVVVHVVLHVLLIIDSAKNKHLLDTNTIVPGLPCGLGGPILAVSDK